MDHVKRGDRVRKAVFPVAGMGTRFLPATKASPKEMMPVVDKPLIQYAVEEAVEAGITELIFVTGRTKRSIADHFDKAYELEHQLEQRGKKALLDIAQNVVPTGVSCTYIRQTEALGLGHAVSTASPPGWRRALCSAVGRRFNSSSQGRHEADGGDLRFLQKLCDCSTESAWA